VNFGYLAVDLKTEIHLRPEFLMRMRRFTETFCRMSAMNRIPLALVVQVFMFCTAFAQSPAGRHAFAFDDYQAIPSATPVAFSADGSTILYRVDSGVSKGQTRHEWKLMDADGAHARSIELPEHFTPFGFTRLGALYGGYTVERRQQLAIVPFQNGAPVGTPSHIIMLPSGIHAASLSPDGNRFAILASPKPGDPFDDVHSVIEADETSLYVVNTDGTGGSWWCPGLTHISDGPISGGALAWSRDGMSVALLSQTPKIGFHQIRSWIDICRDGTPRRIAEIENAITSLAWTADSRELVFLSTTNNVLTPDHVWTVAATGGKPTDRTPQLSGSAMALTGNARGKVWVLVAHGVHNELHSFADGALASALQWPSGTVTSLPVFPELSAAPERLALTVADPEHSANIAISQEGSLKKITTEGDDAIAAVSLGPVRKVNWKTKEGVDLEGIATFPAGYQAGSRYPFLVLPHGGPEGNDQLALDPFSRIIAGLGYVVLQPQYRGSTGYGADFLQAIYQHFGDRAYRDVDSATDYAIAQGWADPNRLAIFGWSAGGFMTSWTVTQTNRYRAAIEGAGITDWASFMWTSDVQQWDYDARLPGQFPEAFRQFSAVMFADKVSTPILILHGDADLRVPTYQGREFFEALADNGKTTRMVTFPGSGHFPSLWEQRRDVFREIAEWLKRYNP
jgi:dipeptidyl aminopeptidase/acylaminoacyl peptidase